MEMSSKAKGDIAEYHVVVRLLEQGRSVLMPCGDRLPYDVGVDVAGRLVRLQVRRAWPRIKRGKQFFMVDIRRHRTNRARYKHTKHAADSYDFLVAWIPKPSTFFVIPSAVAVAYGSGIAVSATEDGTSKSRSAPYKEAWHLLDRG